MVSKLGSHYGLISCRVTPNNIPSIHLLLHTLQLVKLRRMVLLVLYTRTALGHIELAMEAAIVPSVSLLRTQRIGTECNTLEIKHAAETITLIRHNVL